MHTAILSDIHANLEALEAVCRAGDKRCVDTWICLGDIVGYGADPGACLRRTRALTDRIVLGNHDAAAVGLADLSFFNEYARVAARWTANQLKREERDFLANLPLTLEWGKALCVHAEPGRPEDWEYVFSRADARAALEAIDAQICFIGHSHQPFVYTQIDTEIEPALTTGPVEIKDGRRYLVNVGSVGQPRDGDARAGFLIWEEALMTLEFVRLEYDIAAAQKKIIAAGLPPFLAARLSSGY